MAGQSSFYAAASLVCPFKGLIHTCALCGRKKASRRKTEGCARSELAINRSNADARYFPLIRRNCAISRGFETGFGAVTRLRPFACAASFNTLLTKSFPRISQLSRDYRACVCKCVVGAPKRASIIDCIKLNREPTCLDPTIRIHPDRPTGFEMNLSRMSTRIPRLKNSIPHENKKFIPLPLHRVSYVICESDAR